MAKDTFWFSHDFNARNDERILELRSVFGTEGYGIFWMIIETMAENDNGGIKASLIGGLSLGYGVAKETLKNLIQFCITIELFYEEDGSIFSRRFQKYKDLRKKFSDSGKKGAENRWKNRGANGEAIGGGNAYNRIVKDKIYKKEDSILVKEEEKTENLKNGKQFVNFRTAPEEAFEAGYLKRKAEAEQGRAVGGGQKV